MDRAKALPALLLMGIFLLVLFLKSHPAYSFEKKPIWHDPDEWEKKKTTVIKVKPVEVYKVPPSPKPERQEHPVHGQPHPQPQKLPEPPKVAAREMQFPERVSEAENPTSE